MKFTRLLSLFFLTVFAVILFSGCYAGTARSAAIAEQARFLGLSAADARTKAEEAHDLLHKSIDRYERLQAANREASFKTARQRLLKNSAGKPIETVDAEIRDLMRAYADTTLTDYVTLEKDRAKANQVVNDIAAFDGNFMSVARAQEALENADTQVGSLWVQAAIDSAQGAKSFVEGLNVARDEAEAVDETPKEVHVPATEPVPVVTAPGPPSSEPAAPTPAAP